MAEQVESGIYIKEALAAILRTKFPGIDKLKPQQEEAIVNFMQRRDIFAVLPTGWGKSLIFQVVPALCSYLHEKGLLFAHKAIVLVVCPLNSLVESHIRELHKLGIKACSLSSESIVIDEEGIFAGNYSFVFTSPEAIINNAKWRKMLRSDVYQDNVFGLVTDEAHVVPKCGQGNMKERTAAFRACFGHLGDIRSLLSINCPILALTATATEAVRMKTIRALAMKSDVVHIRVNPNRPNIYLYKLRVTSDLSCFSWLLVTLIEQNQETPKTIIYCRRQKDCGVIFRHFIFELGDSAYLPNTEKISDHCLLGMYHANTLEKHKNRVMTELLKVDRICRVVIATTALGMGITIPNVRYVIHYGPPREVDDFMQEIGQGGRDGKEATSVMFYNGMQLRKCEKSMKVYAKSTDVCLRQIILNQFEEFNVPNQCTHKCCIVCHQLCKCGGETCTVPLLSFGSTEPRSAAVHQQQKKRTVTVQEKELLKELLTDYQKRLANKCPSYYLSSESSTGFTDSVISSTVRKCKFIFTIQDIMENVPVYTKSHAVEILIILNDIFEDIDTSSENLDNWIQTFPDSEVIDYDLEYGGDYDSDSSCDSDASMASVLSGIDELHV